VARSLRARHRAASRGRARLVLLLALALASCAKEQPPAITATDPATRRATPSGELIGGASRYDAHAWRGIPYAKPPVGALRWRAPEPAPPWTGVREAIVAGPPCVQYASAFGGVSDVPPGQPAGREDCLTLDVWTPSFAVGKVPTGSSRLPVMVWIHGGGNTIGTSRFYDGGNLAVTENVVVVAVQYRLGPFGWFRHAALRAGAGDDAERSGNFATLDLIRALEWVRDDIAAFGGDPGNVTILGESAGGSNVFSLLLAPQARGLFQRAIVESGALTVDTPARAENLADDVDPGAAQSANEIVLRLLEKDGTASDRASAKARLAAMSADDVAGYLRGKSASEILAVYTPIASSGMIDMPKLFADGAVLPSDPLASLTRSDGHAPVPTIIGTNHDENKLFMFVDPERITRRFWILPRFVDENAYLASAEYLARMWKATGADEPASALRESGSPGVYVYRFDWDEEPVVAGADLGRMLGAAHGFEIPFVFGHYDLGKEGNAIFTADNEPGRKELSRAMMAYWAEFARTGKPGRGGRELPEWAPWNGNRTLLLDTTAGGGVRVADVVETRAKIVADVEQDPRLPERRQRCAVYRDLTMFSRGFAKEDYRRVADGACAAFPLERYPWSKA
jgi:para-nitrobenzyl esterase